MKPMTPKEVEAITRAETYGNGFLYRYQGRYWSEVKPGSPVPREDWHWHADSITIKKLIARGMLVWMDRNTVQVSNSTCLKLK